SRHMDLRRSRTLRATLTAALVLGASAPADAAITTVGPRLDAAADLTTSDGLGYKGVDTAVPPAPDAPNGIVHTAHFGADTAIWNTTTAGRSAAMPHGGEAAHIKLEGCAVQAPGGPPPLDQIHFQTLTPAGGGLRVALSSGAFTIPVCGVGGASGSTVTTYTPFNLCVQKGDYVGFNDEGGFAEPFYRAGVPYLVLGRRRGSSLASFIRGNGTGNGAVFEPTDASAMDGYGRSTNVALMMQVQLGTGPDARYVCASGTRDAPRVL